MAALNLEMTDRVVRTEYSVFGHNKLIERVTGLQPSPEATRRFAQAWDICLMWHIMVGREYLGETVSSMGHAEYAENGADRDDRVYERFADSEAVFSFDPERQLPHYDQQDLIRRFEADYAKERRSLPDSVAMSGVYITAMSGLIEMLGWNTLLGCAGEDPKRFGDFADRYCRWMQQFFTALAKSSVPVVMVHDDLVWTEGPFIHPEWYRRFMFPNIKRLIAPLREAGKKILFTADGNYTAFVDDIAACGIDCFVMEPLTDMAYVARRYGKTHAFIGNADTRVLLNGSRDDIYAEVKRCMDIGKRCPGFIMAVGNHIPANTPIDNCLYYNEFCQQLGRR